MSLESEAAKPSKHVSKCVWVFGGGISGLTAAHELVERGFQVVVVEPELDRRAFGRPDLGGMARTQWALWQRFPGEHQRTQGLAAEDWIGRRALPLIPPARLYFGFGTADLEDQNKLDEYIEKYCRAYVTEGVRWLPGISVTGFTMGGEREESTLAAKRAKMVAAALRTSLGAPHGDLLVLVEGTSTLPEEDESCAAMVEIALTSVPMPGEHGFRYFPAFYRHVFDTMGRIRFLDDRSGPSARPFRTVLDNLVPTRTVAIALVGGAPGRGAAPAQPAKPVQVRRDLPRSLAAIRKALDTLLGGLGYTERDIAHLALKLMIYMTSGAGRREKYEEKTFEEFLEIEKLSEKCQRDVRAAPEVLAGMRPSESDARTQGTVATQLLLNELTGTAHSDALLNGPVSSVWMEPWRAYLEAQGVTFRLGRLIGFSTAQVDGKSRIVPEVSFEDGISTLGAFDGSEWFVSAVPLTALLPEGVGGGALCARFLSACTAAGCDPGDFGALGEWIGYVDRAWSWDGEQQPSGPFRHVAGIQYFFETDQRPTDGHTIYADSAWRLSSISQLSFWTQAADQGRGYRGIVSVDIGEWHTPGSGGGDAWYTEPNGIAAEVWRQIGDTLPRRPARPSFYHLDDGITQRAGASADERRHGNRTPYLITRPEDWPYRPGKPGKYQVAAERWVMCGTFMKTFTRMTTMESANESARHAVNGLIGAHDAEVKAASGAAGDGDAVLTPECVLFNPEEHELEDLAWYKEVDESLFARGLPHALDIVGSQAWLEALTPG